MPLTGEKIEVSYPERPYDKRAVDLSIATIWGEKELEGAVSCRLTPYRVLPDGTLDKRVDLAKHISYSRVYEEAAKDPLLAQAIGSLMTALQQIVAAKGL